MIVLVVSQAMSFDPHPHVPLLQNMVQVMVQNSPVHKQLHVGAPASSPLRASSLVTTSLSSSSLRFSIAGLFSSTMYRGTLVADEPPTPMAAHTTPTITSREQ